MLELMDRTSINAVEDLYHMGLDRSAAAIVIARTDTPGGGGTEELRVMAQSCEKAGATEVAATDDPDEGEAFVAARRGVLPALERLGTVLLEDIGVALPRLPELVAGAEAIAARRAVTIATVAHAGDGNVHPLIVFDPADAELARRARQAFGDVMDLAISLGGTIRRARRRPAQDPMAGRPARPRRLGPDLACQERPRPPRHPQPRSRPPTTRLDPAPTAARGQGAGVP